MEHRRMPIAQLGPLGDEAADSALDAPVGSAHRTRVLCVDDSADIARMLARMVGQQSDLEDAGVLSSAEGLVEEAVRRRTDIVVLDLTMPGPPPLAAVRELVSRIPSCRVIAYSGYDDPETREEAASAGACELVSKHGEPGEILSAIRRAAGADAGHRAVNDA
jgi:DNA-binding NarL/FixJ family response regulator